METSEWRDAGAGEVARMAAGKLAKRVGKLKSSERRTFGGCALIAVLAASWLIGVDPALAAGKEIAKLSSQIASDRAKVAGGKIALGDPNAKGRADASAAEAAASAAESAARSWERSFSAGPDLPALVAQAAGEALAGVSADGEGFPVAMPDGRWLHRVEARVASQEWPALEKAVAEAEKAAGPTARTRAVDIGVAPDGRVAARVEMTVIGADRDWVGAKK